MTRWVNLGRYTFVDANEVVAVHDGEPEPEEYNQLAFVPWGGVEHPEAQSIVLLRNGKTIPAYVSAATVIKRLRGEKS